MTSYYRARQLVEYALQELDGEGDAQVRLTRAWGRLSELGGDHAAVPATIAEAVTDMHGRIEAWLLPRQVGALETAVAWMESDEWEEAIREIRRWQREIDLAVADEQH